MCNNIIPFLNLVLEFYCNRAVKHNAFCLFISTVIQVVTCQNYLGQLCNFLMESLPRRLINESSHSRTITVTDTQKLSAIYGHNTGRHRRIEHLKRKRKEKQNGHIIYRHENTFESCQCWLNSQIWLSDL